MPDPGRAAATSALLLFCGLAVATPAGAQDRDEARYLVVDGVPGNDLGLVEEPDVDADFVRRGIRNGTEVRNLGCEWVDGEEWCEVEVGRDVGWVRRRWLVEPGSRRARDDRGSGRDEPRYWEVTGVPNDNLGILERPDVDADFVRRRIRNGTELRNLGCERIDREEWCEVELDGDVGWVRQRWLEAADGERRSGRHRVPSRREAERIVRDAYQDILDREPDAAGLRLYRDRILDEEWTERQVRDALRESPEHRVRSVMTRARAEEIVREAYLAMLGREPDPGSRGYVDRVLQDDWSQADVERELRKSAEYRNRNR